MLRSSQPIDLAAVLEIAEKADYVIALTIRAVCDLGIADELRSGPRPVSELAAATNSHEPTLYRVLRALAGRGVFEELPERRFQLTRLSQPLRRDHPMSLRDAYPLRAADLQAWARFDHTLRTGEPAFNFVHGRSLWEFFADQPEESARFDRGMASITRPELRAATAVYPWNTRARIVDVGGGNGAFLAGILRQAPLVRGVLLDLPHVVAGAPAILDIAGVQDRCEIIAGSFFDTVPAGADAYVLKRILYSWEDDSVELIARRIAEAMTPQSELLIFEPMILPDLKSGLAELADLVMLTVDRGRTRTLQELRGLLARAGLSVERVLPTFMFPLVVAVKAS